ncbi:MAG: phosphate transporter [Alysiella sp.]|uniref:phosphate transporter n=1 Tax=Alysiella sp. TaxID=1872483 RepID=UPI0026DC90C9|nr:phosphate transporter [Alysiella sp.]MDO4433288.1 phosphate transporter [Alysiella sp.]
MGAYMLIAFILGFWCIWSANREVNSLWEALIFTLLAITIKSLMEWSGVPVLTSHIMVAWGTLFIFIVIILELVDRFSHSMAYNMILAVIGAVGWFFLAQYLFSKEGMDRIAHLLA